MININLFHLFSTAAPCSALTNSDLSNVSGSCGNLPVTAASSSELHTALALFFGIVAVISVLMIIIGGFMFVTAGGNPQSATRARETILYAVVGLVVSILAETVVAFVLGKKL